ncbi:MAG: UDP-N-acetylglucosamine--N-acetylmuramyl-(pentapeptide) pyrophosphoryl-undecaprenol N-acetylglucosamine transferase, partial [Dysgonamonadaceae bacterium]|nr:UDP-N-acetylglucosamine--N-acetylmuramyl-(pentapeptide) pyrophosphoryl-undecaprenol N-acetylglucosamine transferase [Dysgonamonadaceae bacterium]
LVNIKEAILLPDETAPNQFFSIALNLVQNTEQLLQLSSNIALLAQHNSADRIVDEIAKLVTINNNKS